MVYEGFYDKLGFITILGVSLVIYILSIAFNKSVSLNKARGTSFILAFATAAYSYLCTEGLQQPELIYFSELILLLLLCITTIFIKSEKGYKAVTVAAYAAPLLLIYIVRSNNDIPYFMSNQIIRGGAIALLLVFNLYSLKISKKSDRGLEYGIIVLLLSQGAGIVEHTYTDAASAGLRIIAYLAFLVYFYGTTYNAIMNKVNEADKLKTTLEKQLHMEIRKRTVEIERSNERLLMLSKIDALTKAYNKKAILAIIEKQLMFDKNRQFSILMFDIDNFKMVNDKYGHVQGDVYIKTLSSIATSCIRDHDYLGRYGGDEFIAVLPALSLSEATVVAERLKKRVNETESPKITVSIGIASYPQDGKTVEELVEAADKGLYISKRKGRNAISHHELF